MNIHNMKPYLVDWDDGFFRSLVVEYNCGSIDRSVMHGNSGHISFYYRDGREHRVHVSCKTEFDYVFIKQYGIGITEDEKYFFLPRWESGLYCFELETGKMVWKSTRRHPQKYIVRKNAVICHFADQSVEILSLTDGSTVRRYPFTSGSLFQVLSDDLYLLGPKHNKFHFLNADLDVVLSITGRVLNPKRYDYYILVDAYLDGDHIRLSGFEGWQAEHNRSIHERKADEYIENHRFVRYIPIRKTGNGGYVLDETGTP